MEREKLYKRTIEDIKRDFRWGDIGEELTCGGDQRHRALTEVMLIVPEKYYQKLKNLLCGVSLFIEPKDNLGKVHPFSPPSSVTMYLSPILESLEIGRVKAVTAHELAHVVLDHKYESKHESDRLQEEEAAWALACKWGFEEEVKNHLELRAEKEIIKITLEPSSRKYLYPNEERR